MKIFQFQLQNNLVTVIQFHLNVNQFESLKILLKSFF